MTVWDGAAASGAFSSAGASFFSLSPAASSFLPSLALAPLASFASALAAAGGWFVGDAAAAGGAFVSAAGAAAAGGTGFVAAMASSSSLDGPGFSSAASSGGSIFDSSAVGFCTSSIAFCANASNSSANFVALARVSRMALRAFSMPPTICSWCSLSRAFLSAT